MFWAAREIWTKPVFKEVSFFFFEEIEIFYFNLKSARYSQLNSHETVVAQHLMSFWLLNRRKILAVSTQLKQL